MAAERTRGLAGSSAPPPADKNAQKEASGHALLKTPPPPSTGPTLSKAHSNAATGTPRTAPRTSRLAHTSLPPAGAPASPAPPGPAAAAAAAGCRRGTGRSAPAQRTADRTAVAAGPGPATAARTPQRQAACRSPAWCAPSPCPPPPAPWWPRPPGRRASPPARTHKGRRGDRRVKRARAFASSLTPFPVLPRGGMAQATRTSA